MVTPSEDPAAIARNAALSLRQRAGVTSFEDLHALYGELARLFDGLAAGLEARDVEIGILRTELADANARATQNADNARLWFDRVAALGDLPRAPTPSATGAAAASCPVGVS